MGWGKLAGWTAALAGLAWAMHGVPLQAFADGMHGTRWTWLVLGLAMDVTGYVLQGWRWQVLLDGWSVRKATQAVYSGLFTNEILPMRLGEALRGWLAAQWTGHDWRSVARSIVMERVLDGAWLAAGLGLAAHAVQLPGVLRPAANWAPWVAAVSLLAAVGWAGRHYGWKRASGAAAVSALVLITQAFAFAFLGEAFSLPLPLWKIVVVLLVVRAGTAIPNAPANIGSFQFFTVLGLTTLGVAKAQAAAFSLFVFVLLTLPLWSIGLLALRASGFDLARVRAELA